MLLISRFTIVFDTTSPIVRAMLLDSGWLHRFTGLSPPAGLDGSIIIPDAVIAIHQPPQLALWTDGPAYTLSLAVIDRSKPGVKSNKTEKGDFVCIPCSYRWSSRILQRRCPSRDTSGTYPEHRLLNFQRAVKGRNNPPTTKPKKARGCTKLFSYFFKKIFHNCSIAFDFLLCSVMTGICSCSES